MCFWCCAVRCVVDLVQAHRYKFCINKNCMYRTKRRGKVIGLHHADSRAPLRVIFFFYFSLVQSLGTRLACTCKLPIVICGLAFHWCMMLIINLGACTIGVITVVLPCVHLPPPLSLSLSFTFFISIQQVFFSHYNVICSTV